MGIGVLSIAIVTGVSSALIGVFLILRRMSMMTDAITHTVLLGIVLAFLIVPDLNSPLLIIGAVLMGLVTVFLTELLVKTNKIKEDAATGVVFPLLFAIAIIIITLYISDVHMDVDAVLLGKLEFAATRKLMINGRSIGPISLYISSFVLFLNVLFIIVFYKELKIVSFDAALAAVLGFTPVIIHYLLMTLVSLTAVTAFDSVGSILVVALMIGPGITALQFTKELNWTLIWAAIIAAFNSVVGFYLAIALDVTMSGVIATVTLITFILVLVFSPTNGVLVKILRTNRQKADFSFLIFIMHIYNHTAMEDEFYELAVNNIHNHLNWNQKYVNKQIKRAFKLNYIKEKNNVLRLTNEGYTYHNYMVDKLSN